MTQNYVHSASLPNDSPDFATLLTDVLSLRDGLVSAWQERAIMLTREERAQLRVEMETTAAVLSDLARID